MKRGFSLIEIILAVILISIIASIAIPKFSGMITKAKSTSIKQDINTIITSVRNYYTLHETIPNLNDIVSLDKTIWNVSDDSAVFKEDGKDCVIITIDSDSIDLDIDETHSGKICSDINKHFKDQTIDLE